MVNVYKGDKVIATVKYNNNLDTWDGSNWQNGGIGHHLGLTIIEKDDSEKLYVLIHGSDWAGHNDWAEIISEEDAFQLIMRYDSSLLAMEKFKQLNKFKNSMYKEVE